MSSRRAGCCALRVLRVIENPGSPKECACYRAHCGLGMAVCRSMQADERLRSSRVAEMRKCRQQRRGRSLAALLIALQRLREIFRRVERATVDLVGHLVAPADLGILR